MSHSLNEQRRQRSHAADDVATNNRHTPAAMELEQVQDWQPVRQLQHVVDMNLQEQRLTLLRGVELNSWSSRSG